MSTKQHHHDHAPHHHHHGNAHAKSDLTRNQNLVLDVLNATPKPLSAYAILDALRGQGLRAPLQVYRALEKLVELGFVHRLESLNAFLACQHVGCGSAESVAFAICSDCGKVLELEDEDLARELKSVSAKSGFALARSVVELRGTCSECVQAST